MVDTFTIEAVDDASTLMFTSAAGEKAVVIFSTRDKAEAFIGNQCNAAELRVVELTPDTVEAWAKKVRDYGAHYAILDPQADGDVKSAGQAKLESVLAMIENHVGDKQ